MQSNALNGYYSKILPNVIQIVGHTVAYCYTHMNIKLNTHPILTDYECSQGLIRAAISTSSSTSNAKMMKENQQGTDHAVAHSLHGICIDGGMYLGGRAYLQLIRSSNSIAFQSIEKELPVMYTGTIGSYHTHELYKIPITVNDSNNNLDL